MTTSATPVDQSSPVTRMPWQLWVVSTLLALEGLGSNLPMMFTYPVAAIWLAAKILTITGFILRWRAIYVIFLLLAGLYIAFAVATPFVAFLNLAMLLLVASTYKFFFHTSP